MGVWHDWGEWTHKSNQPCFEMRVCGKNSDHIEKREHHPWGGWEGAQEASKPCLKTLRRCTRLCGAFEEGSFDHAYGPRRYRSHSLVGLVLPDVDDIRCLAEKSCVWCGHLDEEWHDHDYLAWSDGMRAYGQEVRWCRNCGHTVRRPSSTPD